MWVYGFQCGEFIKIGVARDIERRRRDLQIGNPVRLKLVIRRKAKDAFVLERMLHTYLASRSIGREWFRLSVKELRGVIPIVGCGARIATWPDIQGEG